MDISRFRLETEKSIDPINPVNPVQCKNYNSAEPTNSHDDPINICYKMDIVNRKNSLFYKKGEIDISTIWSFVAVMFYKLTLDFSYYYIISPVWDYMGFESHINLVKLLESYILLFCRYCQTKAAPNTSPQPVVSIN